MRARFALVLAAFITTSAMAEFTVRSGPTQVPLVELFTSEGCSSCPRADAWMSKLKSDPTLWSGFVPVAFHVDYWDQLGWKDRFAKNSFTGRQKDYARKWQAANIYTPAFTVGGTEWLGWRSQKQPPVARRPNPGVLTGESSDEKSVTVTFTPSGPETSPLIVRVAVLGFDQTTSVARGENEGQTLHHDFVVLEYLNAELESSNRKTRSAIVKLGDVTERKGRRALAVWIERKGDPTPIQAAGGWLNPKP
jgi:hypothetical protein